MRSTQSSAGSPRPSGTRRNSRPMPCTGRWPPRRPARSALRRRGRGAWRSPCPVASTAPSPRCSNGSAGPTWSASPSSSGLTRRPTAPRPAARPEAVLGARAVAHSIDVPHLTLDLEEDFRRRVVGAYLSGHAPGRTPNPCIVCNGEVRLAAMADLAERLGAERLVTGHYARIVGDEDGPLLAAAADSAKDQSYMLAGAAAVDAAAARVPPDRPDQAGGARDRGPPRPIDRPQAREPGPLLPLRPGPAAIPPPSRGPPRSRGQRPGRLRRG